jgi:hypothetical protein
LLRMSGGRERSANDAHRKKQVYRYPLVIFHYRFPFLSPIERQGSRHNQPRGARGARGKAIKISPVFPVLPVVDSCI